MVLGLGVHDSQFVLELGVVTGCVVHGSRVAGLQDIVGA